MNAISTFPTRKAPASLTLLRAAPVATRGRRSGLANARPSPQSQPNDAGHRVDVGLVRCANARAARAVARLLPIRGATAAFEDVPGRDQIGLVPSVARNREPILILPQPLPPRDGCGANVSCSRARSRNSRKRQEIECLRTRVESERDPPGLATKETALEGF